MFQEVLANFITYESRLLLSTPEVRTPGPGGPMFYILYLSLI